MINLSQNKKNRESYSATKYFLKSWQHEKNAKPYKMKKKTRIKYCCKSINSR